VITAVPDAWLSQIMKRPVHRIAVVPDGQNTLEPSKGFYYARVPTDTLTAANELAALGFHVVDVSVTLEREVEHDGAPDSRIRAAVPSDREAVMALARGGFRYSRFHLDERIGRPTADEVKARWAGNFFDGKRGDHMLVAQSGSTVVGFLQLLHAPDDALVIDLIAVAESERGRGWGKAMIRAAQPLARGSRLRVGTQVANVESLRFYENLGFRTAASSYVMHLHA